MVLRSRDFSVIAKHAREDQKDEFMKVVRETLEGIVKNGFDRKASAGWHQLL